MRSWRAAGVLVAFVLFTVPLMPVQWMLVAMRSPSAKTLPHWYHRQITRLFGIRIHTEGALAAKQPLLLVTNHASWLDIIILSSVTPVSFVAKKEVRSWPFVGWLARLQRTVFIDRQRRGALHKTSRKISHRLHAGDKIVFFAEATTSDGNRVLPFKSSLFAAIFPDTAPEHLDLSDVQVQTITLAYTHAGGVPLGRSGRPRVAWYGDMDLVSHAWDLLRSGALDVHLSIAPPVQLDTFADRKALAQFTERQIRTKLAALLSNGGSIVGTTSPSSAIHRS